MRGTKVLAKLRTPLELDIKETMNIEQEYCSLGRQFYHPLATKVLGGWRGSWGPDGNSFLRCQTQY